jgi:hypothetical protein
MKWNVFESHFECRQSSEAAVGQFATPYRKRQSGVVGEVGRVIPNGRLDDGGIFASLGEHMADRHEVLDRQKSQPLGGRYIRRARRWTASFAVLVQSTLEQALCPERGFVKALPFFQKDKEVIHRDEYVRPSI